MGKLITNKAVRILVAQAVIAILVAFAGKMNVLAAPYTLFGQDDPRGALTNSNAARDAFLLSIFDDSTNDLESMTAGGRNAIYTEPIGGLFTGQQTRQYGLEFAPGGTQIFARSSRTQQGYLLGVLQGGESARQYDDAVDTTNPALATATSGTNLMGGNTGFPEVRFDFATNANTGGEIGVKAFGFFGIDAGDVPANNISLLVTYLDNTQQEFFVTPGGFTATQSNNVFFFGVVTPDQAFKSVAIKSPQNVTDGVGYDDFTIGTSVSATVVPENPSIIGMLLGCALTGGVMIKRVVASR